MPIEIFLNEFVKHEGPYQDMLSLEELEDDLKEFLLKKGFKDFIIEDDYTGNTVTVTPKKEVGI